MNRIAGIIAWRYLTKSMYEQSLSVMVIISFVGIFIGSCALALVAAIMHGFDTETRKQMQSIHPQAVIKSNEPLNIEALNRVLYADFPFIHATSPTSSAFALTQRDTDEMQNPTVVMLSAIDAQTAAQVNTLERKLLHNGSLALIDQEDTVIIGDSLAHEMHVTLGDSIRILYASDQQTHNKKLLFNMYTVTIGGIIKTGYEDIDSRVLLCSFELFDKLFPDVGIQELQLQFKPTADMAQFIDAIRKRINLEVHTWQELYPALLAALNLEEYVSFLVIALITLVASMNILALLFMQITNKRTDIALLKTIGMSNYAITTIFMYMGLGIALCASLCGVICASIISFCIDHYKLLPLPDAYYVSHVPAYMSWYIPILVLCIVCTMTLCATIIPTRQLRKLSISTIVRFEG